MDNEGVILAPLFIERRQPCFGFPHRGGCVKGTQTGCDDLAQFTAHIIQAVAHQVDNAQLHGGLGEHRLNRPRETLEPMHAGDESVGDAAMLELGHHLQPELGALGLGDPDTQELLIRLEVDAQRQVNRLDPYRARVARLDVDAVEIDDGIRAHPPLWIARPWRLR